VNKFQTYYLLHIMLDIYKFWLSNAHVCYAYDLFIGDSYHWSEINVLLTCDEISCAFIN
jgi:hypothetical protein